MNLPPQPASPSANQAASQPERFGWLKRLNTSMSEWAASLTWWRMIGLILIVVIVSQMMRDVLNLRHDKEPAVAVTRTAKEGNEKAGRQHDCEGDEIRIGGKNGGIVICDGKRVRKTAPPSTETAPVAGPPNVPAMPPGTASSAPAAPDAPGAPVAGSSKDSPTKSKKDSVRIDIGGSDGDEDSDGLPSPRTVIKRTFGGVLGDLFSFVLLALFGYLIASKVIVRKTAEADAKLRVVTEGADREAIQRQLLQARLKLLQAQVEPHFLFNTLAAVDYLIETDPKRASIMQKTLIGYLRAALPQMRQDSSTLGREVTLIRAYLELLKLRIEDRLEFEIKVPANLESAVFPPMVLQTVVENAIKHGIEPKPEGGRITVQAEVVDGKLRVEVVDTGVGLPEGDIFGNTKNGNGLGLDNIRNRLAMLYPGASSMELQSGYEGGTTVRLSIPYQPQTHSTNDKFR